MHSELVERHFNQVEAAQYLNRSIRWFQIQLTGPNPPPGFKVGKSWVFRRSELDAWLEKFRVNVGPGSQASPHEGEAAQCS